MHMQFVTPMQHCYDRQRLQLDSRLDTRNSVPGSQKFVVACHVLMAAHTCSHTACSPSSCQVVFHDTDMQGPLQWTLYVRSGGTSSTPELQCTAQWHASVQLTAENAIADTCCKTAAAEPATAWLAADYITALPAVM